MPEKNHHSATKADNVLHVIEEMHEGLQIIDSNYRYLYINKAAANQGQRAPSELIGKSMTECYPGIENSEMFSLLQKTMEDGETRQMDNEFPLPDGTKGWFQLQIESHEYGVLIHSLDITERKKLEEKYFHAEKMNALGKLAGGVAHDFNNKLGIMQIYCEMALNSLENGQNDISDYIKHINSAILQSTKLTRQLLALSRKQVLELKKMNLNMVIEDLKLGLGQMLGENIEIKYFLNTDLHEVKMDHSQIDQVLLNLCINAKDSMPEGGTLTIETFNKYLDDDYCRTHPEVTPGDYAVISISDTGQGMDQKTKQRIFEPFFTTKALTKGTGLGLATVHGIVKQARGHIWVYSEESLGSTFKIYFPKLIEADETVSNDQSDAPIHKLNGIETILLAEDDELLRSAIAEALESAGYKVMSTAGVSEAKEVFNLHKTDIDLLITDLVLKKSNGYKLALSLLPEKPDLKVLYISGYTENSITQHGILDKDCVLLQKPFSITNMLEVIRKILDTNLSRGVF